MLSDEDRYIAWTKEVIAGFLYFTCLTLTPTGLILNTLQIAVFARKRFKNCNTGFYFMVSLRKIYEMLSMKTPEIQVNF